MAINQIPRRPEQCPRDFDSRYTVQAGDTMFRLARRFGVTLGELIRANPHIEDPAELFPGDVLCVPGAPPVDLPCSVVLEPSADLPAGAVGSAVVRMGPMGPSSIGILAVDMPDPATFGDFDLYESLAVIPGVGGAGSLLFPTCGFAAEPSTWAGDIMLRPLPGGRLSSATRILVRPHNSQTGQPGPDVLTGNLRPCVRE